MTAAWLCVALLLGVPDAAADAPPAPRVGAERVVLHTLAGDLVLALYPDAAPRTVAHFLRLVRAGAYDTTAFTGIRPTYLAQISAAADRLRPLTPAQAALLQTVPLETSTALHTRYALSFAHPVEDLNGGESSFCIMLANAPHLDGKYTVFGTLERGAEVLAPLLAVPRDADATPNVRLTISAAEVFDTVDALQVSALAPARAITRVPNALRSGDSAHRDHLVGMGLLLIGCIAIANVWSRPRLAVAVRHALNLVIVFISVFLLLVLLFPEAQGRPWLATLLFFCSIGLFKALGRFETAADVNSCCAVDTVARTPGTGSNAASAHLNAADASLAAAAGAEAA